MVTKKIRQLQSKCGNGTQQFQVNPMITWTQQQGQLLTSLNVSEKYTDKMKPMNRLIGEQTVVCMKPL